MTHSEQIEFNTRLAKELKRLKKDAGAVSIRQNYRGTGSQKHVRQLWCWFSNGAVIDIWLEASSVILGGVVALQPNGERNTPDPRAISHEDREPQAIYADVLVSLKQWMKVSATI